MCSFGNKTRSYHMFGKYMVFGSVQLCLEEPKHTEAPVTFMTEAHLWHRAGLSEGSISKLY